LEEIIIKGYPCLAIKMISEKLKNIFLLSVIVFIAHGLEEIIRGFSNIDPHLDFMFGKLATLPTMQALFILFQVMLWFLLIIGYFMLKGEKWRLWLMFIPGLIFIYELHHFYKAFEVGGYYPGLYTALVFPIIGYFYWQELIRIVAKKNTSLD